MKIKAIIFLSVLISAPSALSNNITYVYCGLADGSDWEWLLDAHDNYETIYGRWARITEANGQYFNVFRVEEAIFNASAFSCPAGYQVQPAERGIAPNSPISST